MSDRDPSSIHDEVAATLGDGKSSAPAAEKEPFLQVMQGPDGRPVLNEDGTPKMVETDGPRQTGRPPSSIDYTQFERDGSFRNILTMKIPTERPIPVPNRAGVIRSFSTYMLSTATNGTKANTELLEPLSTLDNRHLNTILAAFKQMGSSISPDADLDEYEIQVGPGIDGRIDEALEAADEVESEDKVASLSFDQTEGETGYDNTIIISAPSGENMSALFKVKNQNRRNAITATALPGAFSGIKPSEPLLMLNSRFLNSILAAYQLMGNKITTNPDLGQWEIKVGPGTSRSMENALMYARDQLADSMSKYASS